MGLEANGNLFLVPPTTIHPSSWCYDDYWFTLTNWAHKLSKSYHGETRQPRRKKERKTLASSSINNPMMDQAIKENLGSHKLSNSYDGPLDHDTHLAQCVLRTYTSRPNTIGSHSWALPTWRLHKTWREGGGRERGRGRSSSPRQQVGFSRDIT